MFWKVISPFVDPVTKAKVVFVRGTPDDRQNEIAKHVPLNQLCAAFGGTNPWEFYDKQNQDEYFRADEQVYRGVSEQSNNANPNTNDKNTTASNRGHEETEQDVAIRSSSAKVDDNYDPSSPIRNTIKQN